MTQTREVTLQIPEVVPISLLRYQLKKPSHDVITSMTGYRVLEHWGGEGLAAAMNFALTKYPPLFTSVTTSYVLIESFIIELTFLIQV